MARNTSSFKIILGSSSTARQKILAEMGYEFKIMTADIDEKGIRKEKPEELVMVLAEAKADAIISKLETANYQEKDAETTLLITADTVCLYSFLLLLYILTMVVSPTWNAGYSGGHAGTVGSVVVTNLKTGTRKGGWDKTEKSEALEERTLQSDAYPNASHKKYLDGNNEMVYFHDIPDEIIDSLIEEEFTLNVAGGLKLEHPLILPFVEAVVGDTDSVMGLPKALTEKLIQEVL
ncbi:hypothetical protein HHK36_002490 [Tetracentron sinense]|uniref:Maf-like protein n=1 Tax=Tetracentron sinense TaxID=13715 RepID=A0A834ZM89_TETSI|nr:hypothetical protein HHK36_002490 [Tetracentron sinense]